MTVALVDIGGIRGVSLRGPLPEDRAFVLSSWHRSYRKSQWAKALDPRVYDAGQQALIVNRWDGAIPSSRCVAHPEGDPLVILGWACAEGPVLHYVYVKGELRRAGLGRALVNALGNPLIYTHQTQLGEGLCRGRTYDPYRR